MTKSKRYPTFYRAMLDNNFDISRIEPADKGSWKQKNTLEEMKGGLENE